MMKSHQQGLTLLELSVSLLIASILLGGLSGAIWQFMRIPEQQDAKLTTQHELRVATTWIRMDANKAQSFQTATPPSFGTFRWLDFSSFPPARHKVSYFWEDEVLYRQPSTDGELEPRIPLARNVSSSADVSFSVTESEHPSNRFSTERLLTAKMTSTIDAGFLGTIAETTTLTVELRPEQSDVLDYLYFYLHNTPPVADTLSQLDLPLDQVKPTSSTLYNYDTNRDAQPGLAVVASDAVGETDPTKYQNWVTDALATTTIDGRMSLYLASAAANFATGMYIVVQVTVKDLDPGTGDTVILPQRESAGFISGSTWTLVSIHYPELTYTIAGGHKLEMTVQISTLSEASGMLAYDTDSYIAFLMVPTVP